MKKIWVAAIIFIIVLSASLSFFLTRQKVNADFPSNTYCGVDFENPIYEFKDSSGNVLLALDNKGNLFIGSNYVNTSFSQIIEPKTGIAFKYLASFKMAFSSDFANISGNILENQPDLGLYHPQRNEMLFKDPITNVTLAVFDGLEGSLYIKGKAIYMGAQAGCTEQDRYILSSGSYYWKEIYCDKSISQEDACPSRNKDLDNNASKCELNTLKKNNWSIGGEIAATTCCGDDSNEFRKTFNCSEDSRCISNPDSDLCCNNINDCVYDSDVDSCISETNNICVPEWDSTIIAKCSNSIWSLVTDCRKICQADSCGTYSTCGSGACTGEVTCAAGSSCVEGIGCSSGLCNTEKECSEDNGGRYNFPGAQYYCRATCDGNGGCTKSIECDDCNDCSCSCGGYNIHEEAANGNTCSDGINNDCAQGTDCSDIDCVTAPNCCTDLDGDGYSPIVGQTGCLYQGWDCNDNVAAIHPNAVELCDATDQNCVGGLYDGLTYDTCNVYCSSVPAYHWYAPNYCCGNNIGETWCAGLGICQAGVWRDLHCGNGICETNCGEECDACSDCGSCEPPCTCDCTVKPQDPPCCSPTSAGWMRDCEGTCPDCDSQESSWCQSVRSCVG